MLSLIVFLLDGQSTYWFFRRLVCFLDRVLDQLIDASEEMLSVLCQTCSPVCRRFSPSKTNNWKGSSSLLIQTREHSTENDRV